MSHTTDIAGQEDVQSPRANQRIVRLAGHEVFIETTSRKKKIINKLFDYWTVKGLLLKMRRYPSLITEKQNMTIIYDFIENHTDLPTYTFWSRLKRRLKKECIKHLTLLEGHNDKQNITCISDKPELYIVISGTVHANTSSSAVTYVNGNLFGTLDRFENWKFDPTHDEVLSQGNETFKSPSRIGTAATILTASIKMCTLLRLSYKDFLYAVLPPKSKYDGLDEDELYIATNPDLSEDDILCIRLCKQSKKTLSKTLFDLLMSNEIIPKNSRSSSFQYMRYSNFGREMNFSKEDSRTVFVIVDGSMRLILTRPKCVSTSKSGLESAVTSSISSTTFDHIDEDGKPLILLKSERIPIMIIELGSVFVVNEMCFNITEFTDISAVNVNNSLSNTASVTRERMQSRKKTNRRNKNVHIADDLYQIKAVFDRPTTYLAIPIELFKNVMKETSVEVNKEINRQLNQISLSLIQRISSLLPWIHGKLKFNVNDPVEKVTLPVIKHKAKSNESKLKSHGKAFGKSSVKSYDIGLSDTLGSFHGKKSLEDEFSSLLKQHQIENTGSRTKDQTANSMHDRIDNMMMMNKLAMFSNFDNKSLNSFPTKSDDSVDSSFSNSSLNDSSFLATGRETGDVSRNSFDRMDNPNPLIAYDGMHQVIFDGDDNEDIEDSFGSDLMIEKIPPIERRKSIVNNSVNIISSSLNSFNVISDEIDSSDDISVKSVSKLK